MARPGPALAAASLRYAPLTPTAQSATYGVPGAATTKLKPATKREAETPEPPENRAQRAQPPPAAEGFRLTLKTTRVPLASFHGCVGQAPLLPSPHLRCPRRGRGPHRNRQQKRPTGCPSPAPRHGAECGQPRPRVAPGRGDWLPPSCEAVSCVPAAAAGATPQVGARSPRGAKRKEKLAPSPGFPLRGEIGSQNSVCGGSCWQSPVSAPATLVGAETLRYSAPGLASEERDKGPSPSSARLPPP